MNAPDSEFVVLPGLFAQAAPIPDASVIAGVGNGKVVAGAGANTKVDGGHNRPLPLAVLGSRGWPLDIHRLMGLKRNKEIQVLYEEP